MYEVIGHPQTRAFRLIWMLEEVGAPYSIDPAMPQTDAARAANPSGKLPVLRDTSVPGGLTIPDSLAAMHYLAARHMAFLPEEGTPERARHDVFFFTILDDLEGPLWTKAKHGFVLPEKLRVSGVGATATKEWERGLRNLAARIGGTEYLTGADFTLADLLLGHLARWAIKAKFAAPEDARLAELIGRILARPALAAAEEKSKAKAPS
jgi:glutathione S-transferase